MRLRSVPVLRVGSLSRGSRHGFRFTGLRHVFVASGFSTDTSMELKQWQDFDRMEMEDAKVRLQLSKFVEFLDKHKGKLHLLNEAPGALETLVADDSDPVQPITDIEDEAYMRLWQSPNSLLDADTTLPFVQLPSTLTMESLNSLSNKWLDGHIISSASVRALFRDVLPAMRSKNNINVMPPDVKKVVVVGDIHGDLASLRHIITTHGMPDQDTAYLFNGDFVDRGYFSVEVLCILLVLQRQYPNRVFLNRGNHEDSFMGRAYGFYDELLLKYGSYKGQETHLLACKVFTQLPLCTFIPHMQTFIAHAGVPCDQHGAPSSPEQIGRIRRYLRRRTVASKDVNDMDCLSATDGTDAAVEKEMEDSFLLEHMMWSDPISGSSSNRSSGIGQNDSRGAGCVFGTDVVDNFLEAHNLNTFIRSHQCIQDGYEMVMLDHGAMFTVFSGADYMNSGNDAAVLVLTGKGTVTPHVFMPDDVERLADRPHSRKTTHSQHQNHLSNAAAIKTIFRALDVNGDGIISNSEIKQGLKWMRHFGLPDLESAATELFNQRRKNNRGMSRGEFTKAFSSSPLFSPSENTSEKSIQ